MITGKRTSVVISSKSVSCFVLFLFLKISLLMAKCQKSENFLSELQQAFLQAKRSVQEQMVRGLKPRDDLASTVWPLELSVFVKGFVLLPRQAWLERAVHLNMWSYRPDELWEHSQLMHKYRRKLGDLMLYLSFASSCLPIQLRLILPFLLVRRPGKRELIALIHTIILFSFLTKEGNSLFWKQ